MSDEQSAIDKALDGYIAHFRDPATPRPTAPCDLIMQGGVASGVVYPAAIMEIAKKHELRGVGGTSAGAIGAVVAAAAEYGRRQNRGAGFTQLVDLSRDILKHGMGRLFQPTPGMRGPFDLLVGLQSRGATGALAYIATNWPIIWVAGALGFLNAGWIVAGSPSLWDHIPDTARETMALLAQSKVLVGQFIVGFLLWCLRFYSGALRKWFDWLQAGVLIGGLFWATWDFMARYTDKPGVLDVDFAMHLGIGFLSAISAMIFTTFVMLASDLMRLARKKHRFGVCSGTRTHPRNDAALMEWLHAHVQEACGLPRPLTFGDLEPIRRDAETARREGRPYTPPVNTNDIELRMTVTDLGLRRPHTLPFLPENMRFVPEELEQVLPREVVRAMYPPWADPDTADPKLAYPLPSWDGLPVLFAVRMSLCYPVLFRMVPLYHKRVPDDPPLPDEGIAVKKPAASPLERTLFTDGGICSNFPIHFYDGLLPSWPTLAIALEPSPDPKTSDVKIDRSTVQPRPRTAPMSLGGALALIFQTAGGWRDQVQTSLPGYRERVCVVSLSRKQGGFDFDMARRDIAGAMARGMEAGQLLCGDPIARDPAKAPFDEAEHRYRRFLVAYARLEETLGALSDVWRNGAFRGKSWADFVRAHMAENRSREFQQAADDKRAAISEAIDIVAALAPSLEDRHKLRTRYDVPEPPTTLRVTPRE